MPQLKCYKWNDTDFKWNETPFTWKEGCIVIELINAAVNTNIVKAYRKLPKEKKNVIISLITKISDVDKDYAEYRSNLQKEKPKGMMMTIKDVEIMAKEVLGLKIEITNVNDKKDKKDDDDKKNEKN